MFELIEIIGLILILAIHELGHAIVGSLLKKDLTYAISPNRNPSVKIYSELTKNEYIFIASSGFVFTVALFKIIAPLFNDVIIYIIFCTVLSFGDFSKIVHLIKKENDKQ